MQKFLCTFLSLWLFVSAFSQAGSPDPTYGSSGIKIITAPFDLSSYTLLTTYADDNGGRYEIRSSEYQVVLIKLLKEDQLDVTFGENGYLLFPSLVYKGSVRQNDGRITVAGELHDPTYPINALLFRFDANGSIDSRIQYGLNIGHTHHFVQGLTLQNDRIVFSGHYASSTTNTFGYWITILNPDGSISNAPTGDPYLASDGDPTHFYDNANFGSPLNVALEGDKVVVEGPIFYRMDTYGEGPEAILFYYRDYFTARYNADGTLETRFADGTSYPFPASFPGDAYTPKTTLNKNVVLHSVDNPQTGNKDFVVTVYNLDGSLDQHFGTTGSTTIDFGGNDVPKAFVWQDGKLLVGGNSTHPETGITSFALARLNADGTLDQQFDGDGKQLTFREGYHFNLQRLAIQTTGTQQRLLALGDEVIAGYLLEDNVLLACTQSKTLATDAGKCRAVVNGIDPVLTASGSNAVVNYTMTGATIASGTGTVSGMTFNKGVTTVTYSLASNSSQTCSFTVTVADQEAPVVSNLAASVTSLWPANHKLVDVWIGYDVADNCGVTTSLSVSSNEPGKSTEPGDVAGDFVVVDSHHVQLRAERMGSGNGRTYTVAVTASDAAGNSTTKTIAILVPKNMGKNLSTTLVSKTAAQELQNANGLAVQALPNPSTGQFTLQLQSNSTQPFSIRVVDAQGRLMEMRSNPCAGALHFGSDYRPGVYFLEVQQGSKRKQLRLLKLAH